jgi:hypothetical protein
MERLLANLARCYIYMVHRAYMLKKSWTIQNAASPSTNSDAIQEQETYLLTPPSLERPSALCLSSS